MSFKDQTIRIRGRLDTNREGDVKIDQGERSEDAGHGQQSAVATS